MKKLLMLFIVLLLSKNVLSTVYPINENFDPTGGIGWTFSNGSGALIGTVGNGYARLADSYTNSEVITLTSPVYDFTSTCTSNITVSLELVTTVPDIQTLVAQYNIGGVWTTFYDFNIGWNTINVDIPNTVIQIRIQQLAYQDSDYSPGWGPICDVNYVNFICVTPLPISLISFTGIPDGRTNKLIWQTATESNNDFFTVEKTIDGINFQNVSVINGAGNSIKLINYFTYDYKPDTLTYYRLKQTDFDGKYVYSDLISIYRTTNKSKLIKITNILGQEINEDTPGLKIYLYSDGSYVKY